MIDIRWFLQNIRTLPYLYAAHHQHHVTRHHHAVSHLGRAPVGPAGPVPAPLPPPPAQPVPADIHQPFHRDPDVFAPHGLNPLPNGPFPLDIPPRQFHPMGSPSSASLVKYNELHGEEEDSKEGGGGLFYGDIPAIIKGGGGGGGGGGLSSLPPLTRHISNLGNALERPQTLFGDASYRTTSSLTGSPPLINAGTPPRHQQHLLVHHGGGGGGGGAMPTSSPAANPFLYNVPLPQTIIYDQSDRKRPDYGAPHQPPQPLLKYHLIRHSFPAKPDEEYFAEVPAFMPGPPYLPKALPSRKAPLIRRPPAPPPSPPLPPPPPSYYKKNRAGPIHHHQQHHHLAHLQGHHSQLQHQQHHLHHQQHQKEQHKKKKEKKKKKKKKTRLGKIVKNLIG